MTIYAPDYTSCIACVYICTQDGAYFLALVDSEQNRLQQHCCRTERHLEEINGTIPEEG